MDYLFALYYESFVFSEASLSKSWKGQLYLKNNGVINRVIERFRSDQFQTVRLWHRQKTD